MKTSCDSLIKLSINQEAIYRAQMRHIESPLFNIGGFLRVRGKFNIRKFELAFSELTSSTDIFYYCPRFSEDGSIFLKKNSTPRYQKTIKDFSDIDDASLQASVFLRSEVNKHIPLRGDHMFKFYLLKIADNEIWPTLIGHHLLFDGYSLKNIIDKYVGILSKKNRSEVAGGEAFSCEDKYLNSPAYNRDKEFWISQSEECGLRDGLDNFSTATISHSHYLERVSATESKRIESAALKGSCSLQDVWVAALISASYRMSPREKINIGVFLHNRASPKLKHAIGLYSSTLPYTHNLKKETCIDNIIKEVSLGIKKRYRHRRLHISHLNEILASLGKPEILVDIAFSIETYPAIVSINELSADIHMLFPSASEYPVVIRYKIFEGDKPNEIDVTYSKELFREADISALIAFAKRCFDPKNFDATIGSRSFLALPSLNIQRGIATALPDFSPIHHIVETQAEKIPNKIAASFSNKHKSYRELNDDANRLAYLLLAKGIKRGDVVGICCHRSIDSLVAVLAIHKAGGCYLPLDPAYPPDRLEYMIKDSGVSLIVGHKASRLNGLRLGLAEVHYLDDHNNQSEIKRYSCVNPSTIVKQDDLAYLIYTSGSTGKPKGVMIQHCSVSNFLSSMSRVPGVDSKDILLAVTSLSFDIHVLELFLPLICGASVVIASNSEYNNATALTRIIRESGITIMQATPSHWNLLLDAGWDPVRPIKALCGGEKLSEALRERFQSRQYVELWNMFGPTETTVWSLIEKVKNKAYIGKPIENTIALVLNDNLQKTPLGVEGELFIGGAGVSKGYWNRPELTSDRFITYDSPEFTGIIYRTGDMVIRDEEGHLDYIGRKDSQVKLGGIRVEVAEVENEILKLPGILSAAVTTRINDRGDTILAAFIEYSKSTKNDNLHEINVRRALAKRLPNHLIPSIVTVVSDIPKTPNQKIDRNALQKISIANPKSASKGSLPQGGQERKVAEIWSSILQIPLENIFRESDLVSLGADSIKIMTILNRMDGCGLNVSFEKIFSGADLSEISKSIKSKYDNETNLDYSTCELLSDQKGILNEPYGDQTFCLNYIFDSDESIDKLDLDLALKTVVDRHTSLRLKFKKNGEWGVEIEPTSKNGFLLYELNIGESWAQAVGAAQKIFDSMYDDLDITKARHISVRIVSDDRKQIKIFISISHLVCDHFSAGMILEDIFNVYRGEYQGARFSRADEIYKKVTNEFLKQVNSHPYIDQVRYWESRPWKSLVSIPSDYPENYTNDVNVSKTSKMYHAELDSRYTSILVNYSRDRLGIGVRDFLIAIIVSFFKKTTRSNYQYIFVHDHGRVHGNNEIDEYAFRLVGAFSTFKSYFLEVNSDCVGGELFEEVVTQIEKTPFSGLGFQQLRNLCDVRDFNDRIKELPGPDIWLNYVGEKKYFKEDSAQRVRMSELINTAEYVHVNPQFPRGRMFMLPWDINNNCLRMFWEYSSMLHRDETVCKLANDFKSYLIEALDNINEKDIGVTQ